MMVTLLCGLTMADNLFSYYESLSEVDQCEGICVDLIQNCCSISGDMACNVLSDCGLGGPLDDNAPSCQTQAAIESTCSEVRSCPELDSFIS